MEIKRFEVGYLQTNCYVITDDSYDGAIVIDAGGGYDNVSAYIGSLGKKATVVLLTHGHFDHIATVRKFVKDGAKVYIGKNDEEMLQGKGNLASEMGLTLPPVEADFTLKENDIMNFGKLSFKVMETPGHTKGGVCYFLNEKYIFSGDTLFCESYGRTDFVGGSLTELKNSLINKLFMLNGEYIVYPGHGDSTTLEYEKKLNPILCIQ